MNSSSKKNHQKLYNLWIHDDRFSKHELIINPDIFPSLNVGDLVEIFHPSASIPPAGSTAHQVSLSSSTVAASHPGALATSSSFSASNPLIDSSLCDGQKNSESNAANLSVVAPVERRLILQVTILDKELLAKQSQLQVSMVAESKKVCGRD